MAENTEETFATKLNDSLTKFRGLILAVVLCVIVVVLVALGILTLSTKSTEKSLAQVDEIYYVLTKDSASLDADAAEDEHGQDQPAAGREGLVHGDHSLQMRKLLGNMDYYTSARPPCQWRAFSRTLAKAEEMVYDKQHHSADRGKTRDG